MIPPPKLEDVPTVAELVKNGLATMVETGKRGTFYRISDTGQQLIYDAMKRNAEKGRAYEEQRAQLKRQQRRRAVAAARDWASEAFVE